MVELGMMNLLDKLVLFENLRNDGLARRIAGLIPSGASVDEASCGEASDCVYFNNVASGHEDYGQTACGERVCEVFYETQRELLRHAGGVEISGNYLQNHLCLLIASEENAFARMAENGLFAGTKGEVRARAPGLDSPDNPEASFILELAAREIELVRPIYYFDFGHSFDAGSGSAIGSDSSQALYPGCGSAIDHCSGHSIDPGRLDIAALAPGGDPSSPREIIHRAMLQKDPMDAALGLAYYYKNNGYGVFGSAPALSAEETGLVPIRRADPITMDDIVGCESQKKTLVENIEILLAGYRANNILLYGDSGTGKSSSVKALLNLYASKGLKLISLSKDKLALLPGVLKEIEGRGMKFIIFIDDLSFEENEHEFKVFKSIIEGRVAPRPDNAIFIVTTNRKNIVREVWADRDGPGDVRARDNLEEKRSLADRFGVTLVYSAPTKNEYLAIVRSIAAKAGLEMPDEELAAEAVKWELRHGGRSGRTARQLVDYLAGKTGASTLGKNIG